ncbi:magnesium transporter NIPA2 [Ostrinia nubilalis]|uniref:magnesium transporter NIPA2 n=1 Tax=Ostrinia nubilalis TaxID=29057 RepID=UPI003082291D
MKTSPIIIDGKDYDNTSFIIGLALAISSSLFIGSSFIIKKIALRKINASGNVRASAGGYGYLKQWMWWLGLLTMGVGEAANLLAYAFAPAALVTPLGALSIIVTAILSSRFLNEKLNVIAKISCFLCIIGSVIFILHSPKSEEVKTFSELADKLCDYLFLIYVATIIVMSLFVKVIFVPRFGNSNVLVYLLMCSSVGSLTVVFCKAVALGIKESIHGKLNVFSHFMFWVLLAGSIFCIMVQMNYLNKSLDIFNTSVVTPVYYVMFTVLVIIASGILFREWHYMSPADIAGCCCGFLVVTTAVFMLNIFKDVPLSFREINMNPRVRWNSNVEELPTNNYMLNH